MHDLELVRLQLNRRTFLGRTTAGIGSLALASLLNPELLAAAGIDAAPGTGPTTKSGAASFIRSISRRAASG